MLRYLVIHDYQHGGLGILVEAESSVALRQAVRADEPASGNTVIEPEDVESHPLFQYKGGSLQQINLSRPTGLLKTLIEQSTQTE